MNSITAEKNVPSRHIGRSILALVVGMLTAIILSLGTDLALHAANVFPPWDQRMSDGLFILATAYRTVYCIAGCYLTARIATHKPMQHALALGAVGFVVSTVGAAVSWNHVPPLGPRWYAVALIVTAFPCAWLGGKLRARQV